MNWNKKFRIYFGTKTYAEATIANESKREKSKENEDIDVCVCVFAIKREKRRERETSNVCDVWNDYAIIDHLKKHKKEWKKQKIVIKLEKPYKMQTMRNQRWIV